MRAPWSGLAAEACLETLGRCIVLGQRVGCVPGPGPCAALGRRSVCRLRSGGLGPAST